MNDPLDGFLTWGGLSCARPGKLPQPGDALPGRLGRSRTRPGQQDGPREPKSLPRAAKRFPGSPAQKPPRRPQDPPRGAQRRPGAAKKF